MYIYEYIGTVMVRNLLTPLIGTNFRRELIKWIYMAVDLELVSFVMRDNILEIKSG